MDIFRVARDPGRARSLMEEAKARHRELHAIRHLISDNRQVEFYYDIVKELIIGIMYLDGYKTLSHVAMISYMKEHYAGLTPAQVQLIDTLRRKRNDITYYGKDVAAVFLEQHAGRIEELIDTISGMLECRLT